MCGVLTERLISQQSIKVISSLLLTSIKCHCCRVILYGTRRACLNIRGSVWFMGHYQWVESNHWESVTSRISDSMVQWVTPSLKLHCLVYFWGFKKVTNGMTSVHLLTSSNTHHPQILHTPWTHFAVKHVRKKENVPTAVPYCNSRMTVLNRNTDFITHFILVWKIKRYNV